MNNKPNIDQLVESLHNAYTDPFNCGATDWARISIIKDQINKLSKQDKEKLVMQYLSYHLIHATLDISRDGYDEIILTTYKGSSVKHIAEFLLWFNSHFTL